MNAKNMLCGFQSLPPTRRTASWIAKFHSLTFRLLVSKQLKTQTNEHRRFLINALLIAGKCESERFVSCLKAQLIIKCQTN